MSESVLESSTIETRALHELTAAEICEGLQSGTLRSTEIVDALLQRRRALDGELNSFVAVCDDAMQVAEAADKARANNMPLSPLHGLPVTIKDSVDLQGYDSTLGIRSRVGKPAARDAVLVAELRQLGAVFLGKTNVPQALLAQETENEVFGVSSNPWNLDRTPGGSSGGESAAVAAGLSPIGLGTDIGGSIRIPAHFCGIVGFKPTLDRWSNRGSNTAIKGQELVRSQIGTLSRSVADAQLFWEEADRRRMAKSDPLVPPAGAGEKVDLRGLRIGIADDDDFLPACASIRRAVQEARQILQEAGAIVVPHSPALSRDVLAIWLAAISSDDGRTMLSSIGSDAVCAQIKPSTTLIRIPKPLRRRLGGLLKMLGEERLALLLDVMGEKNVTELWQLTQRRTELRLQEFDTWNRSKLDAIVCVPHVVPAMQHRSSGDFILSLGAMFRWTLLNFPAGVVPVTCVRDEETHDYAGGTDRLAKKVSSILAGSAGLPVGVQVVARPFAEDVLLAVMAGIEKGARGQPGYPRTPCTSVVLR